MSEIRPREVVILAADPPALVAWYRDTLGFEVTRAFEELQYTNLATASGLKIGIGSASGMGIAPGDRSQNTVVLQVEVDDVRAFLARVGEEGGAVTFGPNHEPNDDFWFGAFTDPEGNPVWVVDGKCPG